MKNIKYFILFIFIFMFGMVNVGANAIIVKPTKVIIKNGSTVKTDSSVTYNFNSNKLKPQSDKWIKLVKAVYYNSTYYDLVIKPVVNHTGGNTAFTTSFDAVPQANDLRITPYTNICNTINGKGGDVTLAQNNGSNRNINEYDKPVGTHTRCRTDLGDICSTMTSYTNINDKYGGMGYDTVAYVTQTNDTTTSIGSAISVSALDITFYNFYGERDSYPRLKLPYSNVNVSTTSTTIIETSKSSKYKFVESKTAKGASEHPGKTDGSKVTVTFSNVGTSGFSFGITDHNSNIKVDSNSALVNALASSGGIQPLCIMDSSSISIFYNTLQPTITNYTATFNSSGGSPSSYATQTKAAGTNFTDPGTPSLSNSYGTCIFNGWYTAASGGTKKSFPFAADGNYNFYAQWSCPSAPPVVYRTVTWKIDDQVAKSESVVNNTSVSSYSPPAAGGSCKSFDGWYTDTSYTSKVSFPVTIASDRTFYGRMVNQCHTVRFHGYGDSRVTSEATANPSINAGKVSAPNVSNGNYVLKGWYTDSNFTTKWDFNTVVTRDMDLYAKWVPTHVVKYLVGPPYLTSEVEYTRATVEDGTRATKITQSRTITGKTFTGNWKTANGDYYNFNTPVTSDLNLYAEYSTNTYSLTFHSSVSGTTPATQIVSYGGKFLRPANPTDQHYTFVDWYTDTSYGTKFDFNQTVTASKHAYAKWNPNPYTVRFDAKEGSPTPSNQTVLYGEKATQPTSPRKALFTFVGWDTNENCSSNSKWNFNSDRVYGDMTLYACYADHAGYIDIKYVDENNEEINPMRTLVGEQDDTYITEEAPRLYSYLLDETGNVAPGTRYTYKAQRQTITYHYTKRHIGMIQVEYRNWETKEILKDVEPDIITGFVDDTIVTQPKDIEGFVLVKSPETEEFTFHEEFDKETDIAVYYYSRDPHGQGIIYVQYLDYDTKEPIQPYDMYENTIGTTFIPINKHIEGYRLILTPPNDTYKYEIEPIVLKMYYKMYEGEVPKCKITVKYVSKDNYASVDTPQTFEGLCGDTFIPRPKELTGYTLIEGPKRPEYVYEVEERILYYVYEKKPAEPVPENPKTGVGTSIITVTGVSGGLYALYWVLKKKSLFSRI
jgi:uncharacterized repeat protein (TIGR02543 family)